MNSLFSIGNVSGVGLGAWQMGLKGWGKEYTESKLTEGLLSGIRGGISFVDTAEIYGNGMSEQLIGRVLSNLERKDIVIATKIAGFNSSGPRVRRSLERSLRRLGTDYIDLYQVHWEPSVYTNFSSLFSELESVAKEGLVEHIGVSNFSIDGIERANQALKDYKIESNQIKFNLIERPSKELLDYMNEKGMKLIAWSPLAQGMLTGKYSQSNRPSGTVRKINRLFSDVNMRRYGPLLKKLREISVSRNITVTSLVLALEKYLGVLPIPGFKNKEQVSQIIKAQNFTITEKDAFEIEDCIKNAGVIETGSSLYPRFIPNFVARVGTLLM